MCIQRARANVAAAVIVIVIVVLILGALCNLFLWIAFFGPKNQPVLT